jgi:ribosomal protein S6--L-glutamate ligase
MQKKIIMKRIIIGWEEWCSFPDLEIPAIKCKTDTGATFSALHAKKIKTFKEGEVEWVTFQISPLPGQKKLLIDCKAKIIRRKFVTSSNGMKENRIVIKTKLKLGMRVWSIYVTLTDRSKMTYRMLLGRQAMKYMLIKPRASFLLGKIISPKLLYDK